MVSDGVTEQPSTKHEQRLNPCCNGIWSLTYYAIDYDEVGILS